MSNFFYPIYPILLLFISNIFMTYAWYGHLKDFSSKPLWIVILISWSVAFLEYCFQVPANRLGVAVYSMVQLKVIQEMITMIVFSLFAIFYFQQKITLNYVYAALCLMGAAFFIFRN